MERLIYFLKFAVIPLYIAILVVLAFALLYRRLKGSDWWVGGVILIYTITEMIATVMATYAMPNHWIYNVMLLPQLFLVCSTLSSNLSKKNWHYLIRGGFIVIMVLHIINITYLQGIHTFANFTYIPACLWMAFASYLYIRDKIEIVSFNPFHSLITWFAIATLIDNVGTIPILSALGWSTYLEYEYAHRLWSVVTALYVAWYLIILFGLLWTKTSLRSVFYSQ